MENTSGERFPVFVYGTLLNGEPNSFHLRGAEFVSQAISKPEYELVDFGPYPAMIPGGQTAIIGEVYLLDRMMLARVDRLEGYPGFYHRALIELQDGTRAYVYLLSPAQVTGLPKIGSGDWKKRGTESERA